MDAPIVELKNVTYLYPRSKKPVLKQISFEIYKGEFLGLIGPTGAGKSTLCLALNGIVPQFYGGRFFGQIKVVGLDTIENPIRVLSKHVCQVFEDPETQLVSTSVENEIAFALENQKIPRDEIMARIPKVLEMVRLGGMEKRHPHELSGGQKQRLAIAAALAVQPDLLILDEPTSQLDPVGAEEVFSTVRDLNKDLRITILMASHAAEEMAEFTDRLILLSEGEIIKTGAPEKIYTEVELLKNHFIRPPEVASTFHSIQKKGVPVHSIPVCLDDGKKELRQLISWIKPRTDHQFHEQQSTKDQINSLLSVKDLKHVYKNGTTALHGVSLDIREGEYILIIGQNGAGKSTLVKHFLKLLEPTEGIVKVGNVDTRHLQMSDLARRIGYVAQNPDNQIFTASVGNEVSFALENLKYSKEEIEYRTTQGLKNMGLENVRDAHPLSLPKGDRARVVIAAILVMDPEIIIFDEPTTGQDFRGAKYILDISRKLNEMGKTVIVITHHLYLMPEYANRVIVMGKGTILLDAPIRKAFHQTELLRSTFLNPPQSVLLAQELGKIDKNHNFPLMTPLELADYFIETEREVSHE